MDNRVFHKLSYGLFVVTAKTNKDNGCITNTAMPRALLSPAGWRQFLRGDALDLCKLNNSSPCPARPCSTGRTRCAGT